MSYTQTYQQATQQAQAIVDNVSKADLDQPTPCQDWQVRQLLSHLIGGNRIVSAAVTGEELDFAQDFADADDLSATYSESAQQAIAALDSIDADSVVKVPWMDTPAVQLANMMAMDNFVHAWDLATATGQDRRMDPQLAEGFLAAAQAMITDDMRGPNTFGPALEAADDAPAADRLAAFMGRSL